MSAAFRTALIVALLHVAIVATVGAKLLVDRAMRPRVWARTAPVDPDLPIRGRYVSLQVEVEPSGGLGAPPAGGAAAPWTGDWVPVALTVAGDRLAATPSPASRLFVRAVPRDGGRAFLLAQPLAYFIPEHAADPSRRTPGEELWVEVTVPPRGAPRPIRLGVKKNGVLTPLELQ